MIKSAAKAKGVELDEATLFNETSYFHTHPYLANFILGMWVKEYEKGGQPDFFYKKVYSSAFGALGDSFFSGIRSDLYALSLLLFWGITHPLQVL